MVHIIDPLVDMRWPGFLERHPEASVFHTPEWLAALRRTYDYEPVVYTTSEPSQELANGIPFCRIKSWLTGKRLVSLPFSDHCQPLVDEPDSYLEVLAELDKERQRDGLRYVELRPSSGALPCGSQDSYRAGARFYSHVIDLSDESDEIHARFHKNAVRIPIRQAEREGLEYSIRNDEAGLRQFHQLMMAMRRKHGIPPQPISWFRNLLVCMRDAVDVRIACKDGVPIASIITILWDRMIYYKYMGYDPRCIRMGGIPGLVWHAIKELKERGAKALDFGRTDYGNDSLVEYKDRWCAQRSEMTYWRAPVCGKTASSDGEGELGVAKKLFAVLPDPLLKMVGSMLYRHIG